MLTLLFTLIKLAPYFINPYYAECVSQQLAPTCARIAAPSAQALWWIITH